MAGKTSTDRALSTPVSHTMAVAITTILIVGLLTAGSGYIDEQREFAAVRELETIGSRIALELARADHLAQKQGSVSIRTTQPEAVSGSSYRVELHNGSDCTDRSNIPTDTCLVLAASNLDVKTAVPVENETRLGIRPVGGGTFVLTSNRTDTADTPETTAADELTFDPRLSVGVGQDPALERSTEVVDPTNRPPAPLFSFDPGSPTSGQTITFDATGADDPDGDVVEYTWYRDGTQFATGAQTTASFAPGEYEVTLNLTDNDGTHAEANRTIVVSGLEYNENLTARDTDTSGQAQTVTFSLSNNLGDTIEVTHVSIDPHDGDVDTLDNGSEAELTMATESPGLDETHVDYGGGTSIPDGGLIIDLSNSGSSNGDEIHVDPDENLTVNLTRFDDDMHDKVLDVSVRYHRDGVADEDVMANATRFTDSPSGPAISDFRLVKTGQDVDVVFNSSDQLDSGNITVEVTGAVSQTNETGDFTETTYASTYEYRADVSEGTDGTFVAELINATSNAGETAVVSPEDDTTITSGYFWASASDWDNVRSDSGVVHASYGDRQDDRIALGYSPSDSGLVGYWPFDGTGSTADDVSGTGNDGTVQGSPTQGANGLFGTTSYNYDGNDDHVTVSDSPSVEMSDTDSVTVSAWVKKDSDQSGWIAIFQHSDQSYNLQFDNGNRPEFTIYDGGWNSAGGHQEVDTGKWYHLVGTFDGGTVKFYLNGTLEDTASATEISDGSGFDVGIAENLDASGRHMDGSIDEVRVYDRALSGDEVENLSDWNGTMKTDWRSGTTLDPATDNIQLKYTASIDSGESVEVTVLSDTDDDGDVDDESDTIQLSDGTDNIESVSGLAGPNDNYALKVELNSTSPMNTPTVESLRLQTGTGSTVLLDEDFESGDLGSTDFSHDGPGNAVYGVNDDTSESGSYSAYHGENHGSLESTPHDTSGHSSVEVSYWIQSGSSSGTYSDPAGPESDEYLVVEYLEDGGNPNNPNDWVQIDRFPDAPGGPSNNVNETGTHTVTLTSSDALHSDFRIRFRQNDAENGWDYWRIDDVRIEVS